MKTSEIKQKLINQILQNCVVNAIPTTGDLFFSLAFRTDKELIKIAKELSIKIN